MSGEVWAEVYRRLRALIEAHRTTLVFVNTRRMAERVARALTESLGEENVTSHHGSLSRERRLAAEQRLKAGDLKALVATASLELGIDIGDVDLVCQLGSTRSISTFLQRAGRSGHAVHGTPKGRLFPLTRDELVECAAILDAVRRGELDTLHVPVAPLDVLAQQAVAMVAAEDQREDDLLATVRRAWPYRDLPRERWRELLAMLAGGFATRRGRRAAYLHRDVVNGELRARRGARLTAMTSGGAIPDNADYDVVLEPHGTYLGSLNEDFAIESLPGDIFQLGNTSWRILRVERSSVRVEDAHGQPPNMPFWLGEAPGRTAELSDSVCDLLGWLAQRFEASGPAATDRETRTRFAHEVVERIGIGAGAADQIVDYLCTAHAALGALPDRDTVVFERFFDESGGMQLVIHSRFGSRLNRAWGLALRKRFCRKFNFELQAAATEDAIVLSLSEAHSFALDEVARYLSPETVRDVLTQALLDAPMFDVRWRWNANVSLAIPRFRGGAKVPPNIQRMQAEDLIAAVFPDQIACAENVAGPREIPDHPLVEQTIADTLNEAMDIDGLESLVTRLHDGDIRVVARDLTEPSPLAAEVLDARPYAFLDDAPLEERRARAVTMRRGLDPASAADIGRLDADAIDRVREEAWPDAASPDEVHDALVVLGFATTAEAMAGRTADAAEAARGFASGERPGWSAHLDTLVASGRATRFRVPNGGPLLWCAAERLAEIEAALGGGRADPPLDLPEELRASPGRDAALAELLRARLGCLGPATAARLASDLGLTAIDVEVALVGLEAEGSVLRGRFTPDAPSIEWCERRLLARIHRYTLGRLRREIEPASRAEFVRFLFEWQRVGPDDRREGDEALAAVVAELEGFAAPAAAWETEILPARIVGFTPDMLDRLCLAGRVSWARPAPPVRETPRRSFGPIRSTPIALFSRQGRRRAPLWLAPASTDGVEIISESGNAAPASLSPGARAILTYLEARGASFFDDIVTEAGTRAPDAARRPRRADCAGTGERGRIRRIAGVHRDRRTPTPRRGRGRSMVVRGAAHGGCAAHWRRRRRGAGAHAAAPLRSGVQGAARAGIHFGAPGAISCVSFADSKHGATIPRRPVRRGLHRRAVRTAGGGGDPSASAARTGGRCHRDPERGGPPEPHRHRLPRRTRSGHRLHPGRVPRRRPDRDPDRQPEDRLDRAAIAGAGVGRTQRPSAQAHPRHAGTAPVNRKSGTASSRNTATGGPRPWPRNPDGRGPVAVDHRFAPPTPPRGRAPTPGGATSESPPGREPHAHRPRPPAAAGGTVGAIGERQFTAAFAAAIQASNSAWLRPIHSSAWRRRSFSESSPFFIAMFWTTRSSSPIFAISNSLAAAGLSASHALLAAM